MDASQLTIPRSHGEVLAWPRVAALPALVGRNVRLFGDADLGILDTSLARLRREARSAVLAVASARSDDVDRPIIMTGHQTEFFHPGVWIKHFLTSALAREVGGTPLALLLDSDAAAHTTFAVPVDTGAEAHRVVFPFARPEPGAPYEAVPLDEGLARASLEGIARATQGTSMAGPGATFCRIAGEALRECRTFAEFAANARQGIEREWGLDNGEFYVSEVCRSRPFAAFLFWIVTECRRFAEVYNAHLSAYRRARRIRTAAHPAPDLVVEDRRCETPFWVIQNGKRARLWVEGLGSRIRLTDGATTLAEPDARGVDDLVRAFGRGLALRPRAIANTLFFRLFVADIFIHGTGGARYDTMTDGIIRDFAGLSPPEYATVSATVFLDLPAPDVSRGEILDTRRQIRDTFWNGERYLDSRAVASPEVVDALAGKHRALEAMATATHQERGRLYDRVRERTAEVSQWAAPARRALDAKRDRLLAMWRRREVVRDRTYPFALYDRSALEPIYTFDFSRDDA